MADETLVDRYESRDVVRVRRRTERDCETVVSWIENAADLYLFTGPRLRWPLDVAQLREMDQVHGFSAWMLVDQTTRTPVGHFDLTLDGDTARFGRVIVDPQRRGQGLSHALVDHAIEVAYRLGLSQLSLNVIAGNEPAIRAYERAGFRRTPGSKRPDVHTMTLPLRDADAADQ